MVEHIIGILIIRTNQKLIALTQQWKINSNQQLLKHKIIF